MLTPIASASRRRPSRVRGLTFVALGVCLAALLAALVTVAVNATFFLCRGAVRTDGR